ncbi:hypothetical protein BFN10_28070 [Pseudomonas extremorientalis]|uniref:Uncharacterized protein n=1 Tax=Pseudomonas extremorientalis TaxID=169669 RepID=A0A1S2T9S3_9PSED|nr:hypothetical protein BFN10_28070 [Pseudomonas extremorientalis]
MSFQLASHSMRRPWIVSWALSSFQALMDRPHMREEVAHKVEYAERRGRFRVQSGALHFLTGPHISVASSSISLLSTPA